MAACQLHNIRCILQRSAPGGRCAVQGAVCWTPPEVLGAVAPAVRPGGPTEGGAWVTTLAGGASTVPPTGAICCSSTLRASRRSPRTGWKVGMRSPSSTWSRSSRAASPRRGVSGVRRLDIGRRRGWDKPPLSAGVFPPCASGHWKTRGRSVALLQIPPCSPLVRDRVRAPAVGAPCSQDAIAYQIAEQLACP